MAESVEPTLALLIRTHMERHGMGTALPPFCFVYGVHWSRSRVRILAHFPAFNAGTATWDYTQMVLAEHVHGWSLPDAEGDCIGKEYWGDALLHRWRLVVSLLAIREQIEKLKQWLGPFGVDVDESTAPRTCQRTPSESPSPFDRRPEPNRGVSDPNYVKIRIYLDVMQSIWNREVWVLPKEWLSVRSFSELTEEAFRHRIESATSPMVEELLALLLNGIHAETKSFRLRTSKALSSICEFAPCHPDYTHPPHLPRACRTYLPPKLKKGLWGTTAHQVKMFDFLSMRVASWCDINIFVAAMFSGFRDFELLWRPALTHETVPKDLDVSLDFALMLQEFPRGCEAQLRNATPPSVVNPAVLLGFRSHDMSGDGLNLNDDDRIALYSIALPYLDIFWRHLTWKGQCLDADIPRDIFLPTESLEAGDTIPSIMFCTYLKAGYIHIIAIPATDKPRMEPEQFYLIDSLPVSMQAEQSDDYKERMRTFVALMTLQRHVSRFAQQRFRYPYNASLLDREDPQPSEANVAAGDEANTEVSAFGPGSIDLSDEESCSGDESCASAGADTNHDSEASWIVDEHGQNESGESEGELEGDDRDDEVDGSDEGECIDEATSENSENTRATIESSAGRDSFSQSHVDSDNFGSGGHGEEDRESRQEPQDSGGGDLEESKVTHEGDSEQDVLNISDKAQDTIHTLSVWKLCRLALSGIWVEPEDNGEDYLWERRKMDRVEAWVQEMNEYR